MLFIVIIVLNRNMYISILKTQQSLKIIGIVLQCILQMCLNILYILILLGINNMLKIYLKYNKKYKIQKPLY